jgi:hypothetical protein
MRLPSPLVVGTAAVFLVSGAARAAKPHGAASPAPSAPSAPDTTAPEAKAPAGPLAPDAAPAAPAPKPPGGDVPTQAPDTGAAAATPVGPPTEASGTSSAAPVVPSASIRRRATAAAPPPKSPIVGDEAEEEVKPARDTVGGHVVIGVNAGLVLPFGSVASGVPQSRTMGVGSSYAADIAYGISRTVMLGAYFEVGFPQIHRVTDVGPSSVETFAAGPLVRYHLVQGVPFDPWVAGGLGFRRTSVGGTAFTGVDWVRLSLGGDWYPAPNLGFGPILELSLGTFFAESPGTLPTKALNAHFVAGVRVVFDTPGK